MRPNNFLTQKRALILELASRYGARNVRVFGSYARGDAEERSDIDLLVDMEPGRDYLDLVGLWQDLEESLGKKIDLLTEGGLSPYLRDQIRKEARPI